MMDNNKRLTMNSKSFYVNREILKIIKLIKKLEILLLFPVFYLSN